MLDSILILARTCQKVASDLGLGGGFAEYSSFFQAANLAAVSINPLKQTPDVFIAKLDQVYFISITLCKSLDHLLTEASPSPLMLTAAKSSRTNLVKSLRQKHFWENIWRRNTILNITNNFPSNILQNHSQLKSYYQKYQRSRRQFKCNF